MRGNERKNEKERTVKQDRKMREREREKCDKKRELSASTNIIMSRNIYRMQRLFLRIRE